MLPTREHETNETGRYQHTWDCCCLFLTQTTGFFESQGLLFRIPGKSLPRYFVEKVFRLGAEIITYSMLFIWLKNAVKSNIGSYSETKLRFVGVYIIRCDFILRK